MVGHDDPDLHAGAQAAARDEVRRDGSMLGGGGERPAAGSARTPSPSRHRRRGCCRRIGIGPAAASIAPPVIVLRFNQPVKPEDVAAHVTAAFAGASVRAAGVLAGRRRRGCGPAIQPRCRRSRPRWRRRARRRRRRPPCLSVLAADWDKKQFPPARDMVVLEATAAVPPDSWVRRDS